MDIAASTPADLGYAGFAFDRCGDARDDPAFVAAQAADPTRRYVLLSDDRIAFCEGGVGDAAILFDARRVALEPPVVFLGRSAEGPAFAAGLRGDAPPPAGSALEPLRALASDARLAGAALALAGCARSLLAWHAILVLVYRDAGS